MARQKQRARTQPAPPALPPETRTVGQVVAETIRFYGHRFWPSVALGIAPALAGLGLAESPSEFRLPLALVVCSAVASLSYALATGLVAGGGNSRPRLGVAAAGGTGAPLPALLLLRFLRLLRPLP